MAHPGLQAAPIKAASARMLSPLAPTHFAPPEGSAARAACSSHLYLCGQTGWLCPAQPASRAHLYCCGQSVVVSLSAPCKGASLHHVLQGGQLALIHANEGTARILWGAWGRPDASRGVLRCGSLCPPAGTLVLLSWLAMEPLQHTVSPFYLTHGAASTQVGAFAADMPAALANHQSRQEQHHTCSGAGRLPHA